MKRRMALWLVAAVVSAVACVTINVYFPEAAIKDLSEQIEQEIARQAAAKAAAPQGNEAPVPPPAPPQGGGNGAPPRPSAGVFDGIFASPAYAQSVPAPEVTSPAIRKIIDSRAARVAKVDAHKATGVLGENNRALLEVRRLDALPDLRARAEAQKLVRDENADREALFREMAAAKGVDLSQVGRIRDTYAATLRQNARPGDWIQEPDGTWKQK